MNTIQTHEKYEDYFLRVSHFLFELSVTQYTWQNYSTFLYRFYTGMKPIRNKESALYNWDIVKIHLTRVTCFARFAYPVYISPNAHHLSAAALFMM